MWTTRSAWRSTGWSRATITQTASPRLLSPQTRIRWPKSAVTTSPRLEPLAGNRNALAAWLAGFDDPDRAEPVARCSYWHHNGFAKLVLRIADDHRVRLHVWPAGENRLGESNPHGHRWNFASTVV